MNASRPLSARVGPPWVVGGIVAAGTILVHLIVDLGDFGEAFFFGALAAVAAAATVRYHRRTLGETEERFRRLAESAEDVIFRIGIRPEPRLEYASAGFTRITGLDPAALSGRDPLDDGLVHPEDRELFRHVLAAPPATPFSLPPLRIDARGRWVSMELRCVPITDAAGRVVAVEGIARDVTQALARQESIRRSESRFRLLVEGLDAIFWEGTPDPLAFTFVSHAAETKLGYPISRWLEGIDFWVGLVHPDDRESTLSTCAAATADGRDHVLTYRMIAKDGRTIWVEDIVRVTVDPSGRPVALAGLMVDVTERMKIQEHLERELAVTEALVNLKRRLLYATTVPEACEAALETARALTGSPFGVVAPLAEDGLHAASDDSSDVRADMSARHDGPVAGGDARVTWPALDRREPVVANAYADVRPPDTLPPGHARIERLLSVPAFHGEELVGQIAVANAAAPYEPHHLKMLERLAPDVALAITRLKAQEALRDSTAQLRATMESAMDAIVSVDDTGRVVLFNSAAEAMFGVPAEDALGAPLDRFIPERFHAIHREHVATLPERPGGRAAASNGMGRRADGGEFPIEASVSTVRVGARRISTAILRDLTQRYRSEAEQARLQQAIRRSADDWRRTFDAMRAAVIVLDENGAIQRLNQAGAQSLGVTFEAVGRSLSQITSREPWTTALRLAAGEGSESARTRVADEEKGRWWELSVTRMAAGGGDHDGDLTILCAEDVTPLVRLETSIHRSKRLTDMGALTAGVAHEVRNPLFAIAASVDALGAMLRDREDVRTLLRLMGEQVDRMSHLMRDLLELGKPSKSEALAVVPIGQVIARALESVEALARKRGVPVRAPEPPEDAIVSCDAGRLQEVFTNLLENAIQHSGEGGVEVAVQTFFRDDEPCIRCVVEDSGPGFRAEDLPRVFEPFFTRRSGGTGLGLSIAQRIAEQHGGRLRVANRPSGGAAVSVEFPIAGTGGRAAPPFLPGTAPL